MYTESRNEQFLYSILDDEEKKMLILQNSFWTEWNKRLSIVFGQEIDIKSYLNVFGGFILSVEEMDCLDDGLKSFFVSNGAFEHNRWYLRGYGYYAADPLMYLANSLPSDYERWQKVRKRWGGYKNVIYSTKPYGNLSTISEWVAWFSLLEFMFNDLTTMLWTMNKLHMDSPVSENRQEEIQELENATDGLAAIMASLLLQKHPIDSSQLIERLVDIVDKPLIVENWDAPILKGTNGYVRAIREADSIPLVYAAYFNKLQPWAITTSKDIFLFSNAFGALNVSLILKHMLCQTKKCAAGNIHYSQNRLDHSLFGAANNGVNILSTGLCLTDNSEVIIIDDCIFTGKSYNSISLFFKEKGLHTMMLPLSLDIHSLKYYRTVGKTMEDLISDAENAILTSEELNHIPPVFVAFWDWGKKSYTNSDKKPEDYIKVMNGGDLLLKELWTRYRDDILKQGMS